ncbi:MAG TPA: LysR family transcriptional regulator [Alphaproteobacteria bacterium]|nr:LysR family transcriptional regulator [Alphaproteobacteria bacterium]
MDRLESMRTLVGVVDSGGISAAAERLGVAKSAVSRRIAELEEHLGAQLLRRTTRTVRLTDTGRSFYERCVAILADVDEAESAVRQEHGALRGRLRVAMPLSFGLLHLGPAIAEFLKRHPDVEFDLDLNDRQVDVVQEGFDVAVRIAHLADSNLIARRLTTIALLPCASPDYLARHGRPETPEALAAHRCFAYTNTPDPGLWRCRGPDGEPRDVRIRARLQVNNGDLARQLAVAGEGVILSPTFLVYRDIARGDLVPLLGDYHWPRFNAYAVYPGTRHLSRRVRAFVDFLAERFEGVPYWEQAIADRTDSARTPDGDDRAPDPR